MGFMWDPICEILCDYIVSERVFYVFVFSSIFLDVQMKKYLKK